MSFIGHARSLKDLSSRLLNIWLYQRLNLKCHESWTKNKQKSLGATPYYFYRWIRLNWVQTRNGIKGEHQIPSSLCVRPVWSWLVISYRQIENVCVWPNSVCTNWDILDFSYIEKCQAYWHLSRPGGRHANFDGLSEIFSTSNQKSLLQMSLKSCILCEKAARRAPRGPVFFA